MTTVTPLLMQNQVQVYKNMLPQQRITFAAFTLVWGIWEAPSCKILVWREIFLNQTKKYMWEMQGSLGSYFLQIFLTGFTGNADFFCAICSFSHHKFLFEKLKVCLMTQKCKCTFFMLYQYVIEWLNTLKFIERIPKTLLFYNNY